MSFASPYLLLTLLALPLLAWGYARLDGRRRARAVAWSSSAMLSNIVARPERRFRHLPAAFALCGIGLLLVGLARPQRTLHTISGGTPTVALAFDLSGSMAATDVAPSRIGLAHTLALAFLQRLPPNIRVALVTFGYSARLVLAPTLDRSRAIDALPTHAERQGTALGDGAGEAIAALADAGDATYAHNPRPSGAILLFSDGGQNAGGITPADVADSAYADGIPIDTVAIGTPNASVTIPIKVNGWTTSTPIAVPVEAAPLRAMAQESGGSFYDATALERSPGRLDAIYAHLVASSRAGVRHDELSAPLTAVAIVLVLAALVLSGIWFGRVA